MSASLIGRLRSSAFETIHHHSFDVASLIGRLRSSAFETIHYHSFDVARGLMLLSGIGGKALPSWDSRTRWNNLCRGLYR